MQSPTYNKLSDETKPKHFDFCEKSFVVQIEYNVIMTIEKNDNLVLISFYDKTTRIKQEIPYDFYILSKSGKVVKPKTEDNIYELSSEKDYTIFYNKKEIILQYKKLWYTD
jgi:hypothetical protein